MAIEEATKERLMGLEQRLRERGVVDVKFHRTGNNPQQMAEDICDALEAVLDGKTVPFNGLGDSPIRLSPTTRGGGGLEGDHHEEQQKSDASASSGTSV